MKVEVPRAEFSASIGRDRHFARQHTIFVVENFQRTWILRLGGSGFVTASYQDSEPIVGCYAYLVGEDAGVDWTRLGHLLA